MSEPRLSSLREVSPEAELIAWAECNLYWAQQQIQEVNNRPFSLDDYPWMVEYWLDESPQKCLQKCTQIAASVSTIFIALHRAYFKKRNQIYFTPTDDAVKEYVQGKFDPIISANPSLQAMVRNSENEKGVSNVHLKQIGKAQLYFRGMKSKAKLISISGDDIIFDELNFYEEIKSVELAEKRASDAIDPTFTYLSHPTVPSYGVSAKYDISDQKEWVMRCTNRHFNEPSTLIPKKLEQWNERFEPGHLQCLLCGAPIDPRDGEWVAKFPDRKSRMSGYWIPRFISPKANFVRLMEMYHDATDIQNFYNTELGLPYADGESRITWAEVMNLCGNYPIPDSASNTTMGVDIGEHQLWTVISRPSNTAGKLRDYVFIGEVKGEGMQKWANLEGLCKQFGVKEAMIDAEPDPSACKEFIQKMGRRSPSLDGKSGNTFWRNRYEGPKYQTSWDADTQEMKTPRTESMDASHRLLRSKMVQFPHRNTPIMTTFAKHCEGTAKQGEMNPRTFNMEYTWVKLGPDHLRHAFNYDAMLWYNGEKPPKPQSVVSLSADKFYHPGKVVPKLNQIKLEW